MYFYYPVTTLLLEERASTQPGGAGEKTSVIDYSL